MRLLVNYRHNECDPFRISKSRLFSQHFHATVERKEFILNAVSNGTNSAFKRSSQESIDICDIWNTRQPTALQPSLDNEIQILDRERISE